MSKKNGISRIELEVNGKKISLSLSEAKELRDILNDLMGSPGVVYVRQPDPWYRWPYITWGIPVLTTGGTYTISNTSDSSNAPVLTSGGWVGGSST